MENLCSANSSIAIQYSCWAAVGQDPFQLDSSALPFSVLLCSCAGQLLSRWDIFGVLVSAGETQPSVLSEKGKFTPESEGSWFIQTEVPTPGPWLVHPDANEYSKSSQFHWSKRHSPDWSEWSLLIGRWSHWGVGGNITAQIRLDRELLYEGLRWQETQCSSVQKQVVQCKLLPKVQFAWEGTV